MEAHSDSPGCPLCFHPNNQLEPSHPPWLLRLMKSLSSLLGCPLCPNANNQLKPSHPPWWDLWNPSHLYWAFYNVYARITKRNHLVHHDCWDLWKPSHPSWAVNLGIDSKESISPAWLYPGWPVQPYWRTGPPGYIGWRNRFIGIDSWAL
jgi:hypothetical protein